MGLVTCVFVFSEAWALESRTGELLIRLFSVAYPPDLVLGFFLLPSVTYDAPNFVFEFGGAVLFFLFKGCWLQEVDPLYLLVVGWRRV